MTEVADQLTEEQKTAIQLKELTDKLRAAGIPLDKWGQGEAKTVTDLLDEIKKGEAFLETITEGKLLRLLYPLGLDVRCKPDDESPELRLKEAIQVFKDEDGNEIERTRKRKLENSLGEKGKPNEDPKELAKRALREELDYPEEKEFNFTEPTVNIKTEMTKSYPGLMTRYTLTNMRVDLTPTQYRPNGVVKRRDDSTEYAYVEKQPSKNIYFVWEPAPTPDIR